MKFIIAKKMNMTQLWEGDTVLAVTPVLAGPCVVTQIKNKEKDGYQALQLSFGERKKKNIKKPQIGHVKKLEISPRHFREFRTDDIENIKVGDIVNAATFVKGDIVAVTGTSKGRGFQGVVKRYGFKGQTTTHGTKDQVRMPGSIGALGPAHVFKGTRMGGHMGSKRITTTNLEVVKVDEDNNILYIKGGLPGAVNGLLLIKGLGDLQVNLVKEVKEEKKEETKEEKVEDKKEVKEEKKDEKKEEVKEVKTEGKTEEKKEDIKEEKKEETKEDKKEVKEEKVEEKKEENKESNK